MSDLVTDGITLKKDLKQEGRERKREREGEERGTMGLRTTYCTQHTHIHSFYKTHGLP